MNIDYVNDLETSLYYANRKNEELSQKIEQLKKERQFIIDFIEENCVYDDHQLGYCFDLPKGKVRTLMYTLKKNGEGGKN